MVTTIWNNLNTYLVPLLYGSISVAKLKLKVNNRNDFVFSISKLKVKINLPNSTTHSVT